MASHSVPVPFPRARERTRVAISRRAVPVQTAIAVFVVLLILFGWLHLIIALQISATDRLIQAEAAELERLKRKQVVLLREISEAQAPASLEDRAMRAGYAPQKPTYLMLEPLGAEREIDVSPIRTLTPNPTTGADTSAPEARPLLDTVMGELAALLEPGANR